MRGTDKASTVDAVTEGASPSLAGLRILHVLDHSVPIHSGYSFRSIALFREQRRRGWYTAHLTTPKHRQGAALEEVGDFAFHRTAGLRYIARYVPVLSELAIISAVARRIADVATVEKPEILHAHSPVLNALACLLATQRLRLPVVYEVRGFWEDAAVSHGTTVEGGWRYRTSRLLETYALKQSHAVTTICEGLRRDMLARGIAADKITIIPNGVDVREFPYCEPADPALRASLELDNRIVIGFLGSFYSYEGLDLLLSALPSVLQVRPEIVLLLVGGGPVEDALKAQVRRLGIGGAVRFVGRVAHDRIRTYYNLVDIFVYPRLPMRLTETVTPLKPLEAMARGGIVLVSDVGGHRELVRDGETGYHFRAGDPDALSRSILDIMARPSDWDPIRLSARRFVETQRTWSQSAAGYCYPYSRALSAVSASYRWDVR
jgi:PEP-CTERM/exosortase A-associated glycosyltransferase